MRALSFNCSLPLGLALVALAGCAPLTAPGSPAPAGAEVALGQPVEIGGARVATSLAVAEDSRCPVDARCPWAGRLVVRTRIDGAGWGETLDLTLGEPRPLRGVTVTLVAARPDPRSERKIAPGDYRFTFAGRAEPGAR